MDNQTPVTPPTPPRTRRFPRMPRLAAGPKRRAFFRILGIAFLVMLVATIGLGFWVYREAVGRFEVRKLSLPTRIYADYLPLQQGAALQNDDLMEKLDRLGYRETPRAAQPGEFAKADGGIDIHLRAFRHPTGEYPAQPVRLTIRNSQIESVVNLREARPLTNAALEPELLTSILNDELENRRPVTLQQVPQHLKDAVVVTEDVRFWHHPGVDPFGIFRALFRNVKAGGVSEGASTLTQQLVKNYYLTSERTFKRKIVEAGMAVILDAKYSKPEILEAYLNDIYLGRNRSISILGVGEASRFYFGKPVAEISIAEAAVLAGMIRSPNNISPFNNPETSMKRRNTVLALMLKEKKITQAQYEEARSAKLPKKPFRDRSGLTSIPFYVDRVMDEMKRDYGIDDVKGRGLQIYTAIDLGAQDTAARTLEAHLRGLERSSRRLRREDPLQGVIIHADVPTGEIRALVGGRNYERSQFNRALRSKRLVGSLFKPFVYLAAFEPSLSNQNITPATLVSDTRFVLERRWSEDWSPRNYDNRYMGNVTVRVALEESLNSASVRIGLATGIAPILKTARTLGVSTEMDDSNPSIILGAVGIPPIEMAEAYSTIARQGARMPLRTIRFVTNDRGRVMDGSAGEIKPVQVFPQRDVYLLTHVMEGVVNDGTAARARGLGFRKIAAGKTGTTNDKRDAWFIGFTPQTLALTWVGFDDNTPTGLSGSDAAVPMWARYMNAVTAGQPNRQFPVAPGVTFSEVDEMSGGLATPYCPAKDIVQEAFKAGTEPRQPCPLHMGPQLAQTPPAAVPMYDQYGNPVITNTGTPMTSASRDSTYTPPPPPTPPDSTLTGGFGRTDTGTPPQTTTTEPDEDEPAPPPTDTTATTPPTDSGG
ncbi:MAG TPA: PBP1A family penicillin-binding protein [Thermoanaerobaculia bacterium]